MLAVITEVKHKLLLKAIDKFSLLNSHMRSDTDGAPACPDPTSAAAGPGAPSENEKNLDGDAETPAKKLLAMLGEESYIKEYPECPMAFD